jgi:hypothetical protein
MRVSKPSRDIPFQLAIDLLVVRILMLRPLLLLIWPYSAMPTSNET